MSLNDIALDDLAGTNTAVVGTLRSGVPVLGPAVGAVVEVEESVLLLETEPGVVVGMSAHELGALVTVVELVGGTIGVPALREDKDVGDATERVGEDGNRLSSNVSNLSRHTIRESATCLEVDVRVLARGLAGRGTVKVPYRELIDCVATIRLLGKSLEK